MDKTNIWHAEQVKQQRIANLIAFAALDNLSKGTRTRAMQEAYRELFERNQEGYWDEH